MSSNKGANQGAKESNTYNFSWVEWTQWLTYMWLYDSKLAEKMHKNATLHLFWTTNFIVLIIYCMNDASIILLHILCVYVSVIFKILKMGGRRAMVLTPMWWTSPGKLWRQLLELTQHMVWERKPLELFLWWPVKPRDSNYNDGWPSSWESLSCSHQLGRSKEEERLHHVGSFANAGWKQWWSGNRL